MKRNFFGIFNFVVKEKFDDVLKLLNEYGYEKTGVKLLTEKDKYDNQKIAEKRYFLKLRAASFIGSLFSSIDYNGVIEIFGDIDTFIKIASYICNQFSYFLYSYIDDYAYRDYFRCKHKEYREKAKQQTTS